MRGRSHARVHTAAPLAPIITKHDNTLTTTWCTRAPRSVRGRAARTSMVPPTPALQESRSPVAAEALALLADAACIDIARALTPPACVRARTRPSVMTCVTVHTFDECHNETFQERVGRALLVRDAPVYALYEDASPTRHDHRSAYDAARAFVAALIEGVRAAAERTPRAHIAFFYFASTAHCFKSVHAALEAATRHTDATVHCVQKTRAEARGALPPHLASVAFPPALDAESDEAHRCDPLPHWHWILAAPLPTEHR